MQRKCKGPRLIDHKQAMHFKEGYNDVTVVKRIKLGQSQNADVSPGLPFITFAIFPNSHTFPAS